MLRPEAAWELLATHLAPLGAAELPRAAALGKVLARDLAATVDTPPADVSAMDGYALRGEVAAGERLPVTATIAAGAAPGWELPAGAVARIMTGAPLPTGADRVVPVEHAERVANDRGGGEQVVIQRPARPGDHIRRRGEVTRAGEPLLAAGTLLGPGALALLATHGHGQVPVHAAPRVALLTTGDEVVPPETMPAPGQLRDSHTDFLLAATRSLGIAAEPLGIAPDRPDELRRLLERGLAAADVLLVCGGVSAGEFDFVEGVLRELAAEVVFDAVAIQPGKPLLAAVRRRPDHRSEGAGCPGPSPVPAPPQLVFGLPGNPASVMACFWLFVRPALRRLQGSPDGFWHGALAATLTAPLPAARGRDRFLPAEVAARDGRLLATPVAPRGSHDLAAFARGTALVRVRAEAPPAAAGESCELLPLADWRLGREAV